MLRHCFNGTPILSNSFRPKTDRRPHLGEDYALQNRVAIIAMADGMVNVVQSAIEKVAGARQWIANTENDPYKRKIGKILILRSLKTEDYGNYIKIDHGSGISTLYAHLDEVIVSSGQYVKEGELIGYSDSTGNSTGGHVHVEIRKNNISINPEGFDFSFVGKGGVNPELVELRDTVKITIPKLYVRSRPTTIAPLSGSKELSRNNQVVVVGFTLGEEINGNNFWYKSTKGNYFWAGGTDRPDPKAPVNKNMTQEEYNAKKEELETRKSSLEARKTELENATSDNTAAIEAWTKDWEAFAGETVDAPEVVETPVEELQPVTEEVVVEATTEGLPADEEKAAASEYVSKLESLVGEIKSRFGL